MPTIWPFGQVMYWYGHTGNSVCVIQYGTIDRTVDVAYKFTKRSDGKFWIEVLLDGEFKCEYENTTPICMDNIKFYASKSWSGQTQVTINKFKIITGKLDSNTICIRLVWIFTDIVS